MRLTTITPLILVLLIVGCEVEQHEVREYPEQRGYETEPSDTYRRGEEKISEEESERFAERRSRYSKENTRVTFSYMLFSWGVWIAYYLAGIIIGVFVYRDAKKREILALNIKPFWWAVITVIEPPLGVLAYWIIHYSSITKQTKSS